MAKKITLEEIPQFVATKITDARRERKWTKTKLAIQAQVHATHISRLESGERNLRVSTLCQIALALEVNPAELLPTRKELEC